MGKYALHTDSKEIVGEMKVRAGGGGRGFGSGERGQKGDGCMVVSKVMLPRLHGIAVVLYLHTKVEKYDNFEIR